MIDAVIYDIGRVLVGFEWMSFVRQYFCEEKAKILTKAIWEDGRWNELDRGVLSYDDVVASFKANAAGCEKDIDFVMEHVKECLTKHDYAIPWIKEVKAMGKKVYYLSNYSSFLRDEKEEVLDFLPYMDGGVFSYQEGCIKPDKRIYDIILTRYDIEPSKALFIDDNRDNIEAANTLGIGTHLFTSYEVDHDDIMRRLEDAR